MVGPALHTLAIADDPDSWARAGFHVEKTGREGIARIGPVRLRLLGHEPSGRNRRGIVAWSFDGIDDGSIDGLTTVSAPTERPLESSKPPTPNIPNPNGATRLDHVVMITPDLDRSIRALRMNGFEPRRTREIPDDQEARRQVFFWAGSSIIELVGPVEPTGSGPASLWGLAITTNDLDTMIADLGSLIGAPKPAVQPGRRIATLRTADLDISVTIAFLSPHAADDDPDA